MAASSTLEIEGRPASTFAPLYSERKRARLIALGENAVTPFPTPGISTTLRTFKHAFISGLNDRLGDTPFRLKVMDADNIGAQILSFDAFRATAEQLGISSLRSNIGCPIRNTGSDTTANTARFTTWELASRQDIQAKLFEGLQEAFPDPQQPLELTTLENLPFLDGIFAKA
ncbi:hypothetical protein PV10_05208 [Exophiala mesophila]|uniref:Uncharacterized protein n=1 Tax=Exophiala mesophila TaxID=212818 RepID=A0A0D1Y0P5_EXOME|nr:uncharacterized protein PV10_05208 [Exophiala mesophila]KIV94051.1 hypothetical protein PV10_05208 [Exophiala mesophila]